MKVSLCTVHGVLGVKYTYHAEPFKTLTFFNLCEVGAGWQPDAKAQLKALLAKHDSRIVSKEFSEKPYVIDAVVSNNNTYNPKRFNPKVWLVDAPSFVLGCYDHGETCGDRYTVFLHEHLLLPEQNRTFANCTIAYLGLSTNPCHPQGISQFGEMSALELQRFRDANRRYRTRWLDLPERVRRNVVARAGDDNE